MQIIEYQTARIDELSALGKEFRDQSASTPGVAKPLRGKVAADTDRPGYYLSIIEFDSQVQLFRKFQDRLRAGSSSPRP